MTSHCHIAEHHESGMMFSFNVDEGARSNPRYARVRKAPQYE